MTTIKVDFNSLTTDGELNALLRLADAEVEVGERVTVLDMFEGEARPARIISIDRNAETLVLDVQWEGSAIAENGRNVIESRSEGILLTPSARVVAHGDNEFEPDTNRSPIAV